MNKTADEALALISEVTTMVNAEITGDVRVVLCPPALYLTTAKAYITGNKLALGAQNCHEKESGAYTGELSAAMLASAGVTHVLIGHSERRQYFGETNQQLAQKVDVALANGLTPIFCCGESQELREEGDYVAFVQHQLTQSLFHLQAGQLRRVVIAYEPIWAIGTGLTATSAQAQAMHQALRQHLASHYGDSVAQEISILYGGSANAQNAADLFAQPDIDGGLIGGASLKARDFLTIIKARQ